MNLLTLSYILTIVQVCVRFHVVLGDVATDANSLSFKLDEYGQRVLGINEIQAHYNSVYENRSSIDGFNTVWRIANETVFILSERAKAVKDVAAKVAQLYVTNSGKSDFKQCCDLSDNEVTYDFRYRSSVNYEKSCVRLPEGHPTLYGSMTQESQIDIKVSNDLGQYLLEQTKQYDTMKWLFFGSNNGVHTLGPAGKKKSCIDYDPRYRPWYVAASTVPKLVILVVDSSGSMTAAGRMSAAISAAKTVLSTLNPGDWVNVIDFDSTARAVEKSSCGNGYALLRATPQNVDILNKFVDGLEAEGGTNFQSAFEMAYRMLTNTRTLHPEVSSMPSALIFMTDGESSAPTATKPNDPPIIFSFAFGSGVGADAQQLLQNLASESGGSFKKIPDGSSSELRTAMASYYLHPKFLSEDAQESVTMTAPFYSVGLGIITAIAYPVFVNGVIRGVAGVDVSLSEFLTTTSEFGGKDASYIFILDSRGDALLHPNLPLAYSVSSEQTRVNIRILENPSQISDNPSISMNDVINMIMDDNNYGSAHFSNIKRFLPRGEGTEGTITVLVNGTYYWKTVPVPGTKEKIRVGLFLVDPEFRNVAKATDQPTPTTKSVYHRFDLLDNYGGEEVTTFNQRAVTTKKSVFFYSSRLYNNPEKYLEGTSQTKNDVEGIQNDVNNGVLYSKLKPEARSEARASSVVDTIWKSEKGEFGAASADDVSWRYIGLSSGAYRIYPGVAQSRYYDPISRPWYARAILFPGKYTITLRNKYSQADGTVYSLTKSLMVNGMTSPNIVVGADFSLAKFTELFKNNAPSCAKNRCVLIDSNAYAVYDTDTTSDIKNPKPIGQILPDFAYQMKQQNKLSKNVCNDYGEELTKLEFSIQGVTSQISISAGGTTYTMVPVPNTNLYLISLSSSSPSNSYSGSCSKDKCLSSAADIYGTSGTDICPCSVPIEYSSCDASFLVTQYRPLCAVAPPPTPDEFEQVTHGLPDWALGFIIVISIVLFTGICCRIRSCREKRRLSDKNLKEKLYSTSSLQSQMPTPEVTPPQSNSSENENEQKPSNVKNLYPDIPIAIPISERV